MLMRTGCNRCASLAGLALSFIACFILLVIAPLDLRQLPDENAGASRDVDAASRNDVRRVVVDAVPGNGIRRPTITVTVTVSRCSSVTIIK